MADTSKLRDMLQDLINDKPEQAQVNLHDYLVDKMRDVSGNTSAAPFEVDDGQSSDDTQNGVESDDLSEVE